MATSPLVDRRVELERLRALVARRDAAGAILSGALGIGKTTLVRRCADFARDAGMSVAMITGTAWGRRLPFGAFAQLLPADPPDSMTTGAERSVELLHRYGRALLDHSNGRRLLLVVDDAHLLDEESAVLLHQIATTRRLALLVTVESGAATVDAVTDLRRDDVLESLALEPLSLAAIDELVTALVGGPVDPAAVRLIASRAHGNPLFVRELVVGSRAEGSLVEVRGMWRFTGRMSSSRGLAELVETRIGDLDADAQALLDAVALAEPIGCAELAAVADESVVVELERRELVVTTLQGRRLEARLAHPIYGHVLRERISALKEWRIAGALAATVERLGARRREDTLRVASWRLVAGGGDPDTLLAGAAAARRRHDYALTEQLARAAIAAGAQFEARFLLAEALYFLGRHDDVERELTALADDAVDDAQRAHVALARFDYCVLARTGSDLGVIEEAEKLVTDPAWRQELVSRRLAVAAREDGPRRAVDLARGAVEPLQPPSTSFAVVHARSLARMGRIGEALAQMDNVRPVVRLLAGSSPARGWYYMSATRCRAMALAFAGRLDDAAAILEPLYEQALASGKADIQGYVAGALAELDIERGQVASAARRCREALAFSDQTGAVVLTRAVLIIGAYADALAGRAADAARWLEEFERRGIVPQGWDAAELLRAKAWVAASAGNATRAGRLFVDAAETGDATGDLVTAVDALHALARTGRPRDALARIVMLAEHVEGELTVTRVRHVQGLVGRDAPTLAEVSHGFEALGALLLAAEAAADAAVAAHRRGRPRDAAAAEHRASALAARCAGAATPALRTVTSRARLTPSELQTATLAASGHTNREIAEQLFLSVRTVENRLQRVYEKLGLRSRQELGPALHDHP